MAASTHPAPPELLQLLQQPSPASCRAETVDFAALGFSEHEDAFAVLVHDLLSPDECDALLHAAEQTSAGRWDAAMIAGGADAPQVLNTDVRLCDRIIWDETALAGALLARIAPHLPADITTLKDRPAVTATDPEWEAATWRVTRLNERLRFLRYRPGMYFRPHYDAHYMTPDGREVSFLTVHLYLRGSADREGGATRFFAMDVPGHVVTYDVDPAPGSCLIFQHHDLEHSGDDVRQGTKYTVRSDLMYERVQPGAGGKEN